MNEASADDLKWPTDTAPSRDWPIYTRGGISEVFPGVIVPLAWDLVGREAELGCREWAQQSGLLAKGDFAPDEPLVILGVFGGYGYLNASFLRVLGLRAPGRANIDSVDQLLLGQVEGTTFAHDSAEPATHGNRLATVKLARTIGQILGTTTLPELESDDRRAQAWISQRPASDATDEDLLDYFLGLRPLFGHLVQRLVTMTMAELLARSALADLLTKIGCPHRLGSLLGGDESLTTQTREDEASSRQALNPLDRRIFDRALRSARLHAAGRHHALGTITTSVDSARAVQRDLAARATRRGGPTDPAASLVLGVEEFRQFVSDPVPFASVIADRQARMAPIAATEPPFLFQAGNRPVG